MNEKQRRQDYDEARDRATLNARRFLRSTYNIPEGVLDCLLEEVYDRGWSKGQREAIDRTIARLGSI